MSTTRNQVTIEREEGLSVAVPSDATGGGWYEVGQLVKGDAAPFGDVHLRLGGVEVKAYVGHGLPKGLLSGEHSAEGSRDDDVVGVRRDEDSVVSANFCDKWMEGESEKSAAEGVALLDSSFAVNEGHLSIVEEHQVTLATVMCLNVLPKDVPFCWSGQEIAGEQLTK